MCFASSIVEAHKKLFITAEANDSSIAAPSTRYSNASTNSSSGSNSAEAKVIGKHTRMSRTKSRLQLEVCGDCGASDPSWASINRGILLCADCCSVHRSLGRHISIVKSLRQGTWEPSVLNFVNSLNAHGANSVWEHHLLDGTITATGGGKNAPRVRKPTSKDPLHPVKSDFIKTKHVNLAFVLKPNLQEDGDDVTGLNLELELSRQLHASVRTSNLETSLRLLVQGAEPNYFHEEKRSTPLHVAAKFGQASQIELLIIYGANINAIDGNGLTPLEVARANNHNIIGERLMDAMYEVTDRITTFLGGKKPDHASGRHLIIPEANVNSAEISEQLKIARGRLQLVPNKMFEELVMDLYDEVDRRENEAIWATSILNAENAAVPFLPANPFLSATRNQGRQKLARFNRSEFAGLLTDVLIDARRRQKMANLRPIDAANQTHTHGLYNNSSGYVKQDHDPNLSDDEPIYDPVASDDDYAPVLPSPIIAQQPTEIGKATTPQSGVVSTFEMDSLRKQINEYVSEINQLKTVVQKLSSENSELKSKFSTAQAVASPSVYDEPLHIDLNCDDNDNESLQPLQNENVNTSNSTSTNSSNQSTIKRPASMYEQRRLAATLNKTPAECRTTTSMYQMAEKQQQQINFGEDVKQRTDVLTRRLKELITAMQDAPAKQALVPFAERIRVAVMDLVSIFSAPSSDCNENIKETFKQLPRYSVLIQHACENLQNSYTTEDKLAIEKYTQEVRDCAYYIASAIKTVLMQYE